jgi:conjugation system TraG family ATPase
MNESTPFFKVVPVYKVEYDCILSKHGDVTLAYEVQLPEIFTMSDQEYEAFHQTLIKAIKVLPANSIFHKQDWFLSKRFEGQFEDKVLSFLSHSSERFFNERPYLDHTCNIMLTRKPANRKTSTSMFSTLTKQCIVPDETVNPQRMQEFLDSAGQFERILQDSGFAKLKRIKDEGLTGSRYQVGLLEQYCFLQSQGAVPMIKDISFKDGITIGDEQCKLFVLSDVEDLPGMCGSRINYDRYSTDKTKFSVGFASPVGQLLSCNHVYNQYIFIEDVPKTIKSLESKRLRLQSLANYSRENAISKDATNDFLNEIIGDQRLPVKAHFNVLAWTDKLHQP